MRTGCAQGEIASVINIFLTRSSFYLLAQVGHILHTYLGGLSTQNQYFCYIKHIIIKPKNQKKFSSKIATISVQRAVIFQPLLFCYIVCKGKWNEKKFIWRLQLDTQLVLILCNMTSKPIYFPCDRLRWAKWYVMIKNGKPKRRKASSYKIIVVMMF